MDAGTLGAIAGILVAAITILGFGMRHSDRITKANSTAESALQTAAECDELHKETDQRIGRIEHDFVENMDRIRREFGETVSAMQTKIHEFETWSRDEFMRKQSFEAIIVRSEKAQEVRDERLERRLERIEKKLDEAASRNI